MRSPAPVALVGLVLVVLSPGVVGAGTCTVPGSHVSIQDAVSDPGCGVVELAAQSHVESIAVLRSLTLAGPATEGAVLEGKITATGAGVVLGVVDLAVVTSCPRGVEALNGSRIAGDGLDVVIDASAPCPPSPLVFADGFESGSLGSWSASVGATNASGSDPFPGAER